eukprot:6085186-Prorocentrum_lima.AAC.1
MGESLATLILHIGTWTTESFKLLHIIFRKCVQGLAIEIDKRQPVTLYWRDTMRFAPSNLCRFPCRVFKVLQLFRH